MKAVLDRLVYGMNKYYGGVEGDSLYVYLCERMWLLLKKTAKYI